MQPRSIDIVGAAHIHDRTGKEVEVAEVQAVPVGLGQKQRLLGVHRVGECKQRLQLASEIEARHAKGVQLIKPTVPVSRRVGEGVQACCAVIVLVGGQSLEGVEGGLVTNTARQAARPAHARKGLNGLNQVKADHAPPYGRAGLNARNALAWAGTEAAVSLGAGVAVAVRKGMGRNLRARPALCYGPGLRRGYARVVVRLRPAAVRDRRDVARLIGRPTLLQAEHRPGVIEVVIGDREAEHVCPRHPVGHVETRGPGPVVVRVAILSIAVHINTGEVRRDIILETPVQGAAEVEHVVRVSRIMSKSPRGDISSRKSPLCWDTSCISGRLWSAVQAHRPFAIRIEW